MSQTMSRTSYPLEFSNGRAPRGWGLKEIKGAAVDDQREYERKQKMVEHSHLLAKQVEENARRKAAEKAATEEHERR